MGLDMWFKEDIRNILYGLGLATPRMGRDYPDGGQAFQAGYAAALEAVAGSLGIGKLPGLSGEPRNAPIQEPRLRDVTPQRLRLTGR